MRHPQAPGGGGAASTVPMILDGTGKTTSVPLTIKNEKPASGVEVQSVGTARSGFVLLDTGGTFVCALGFVVTANDWFSGSLVNDSVLYNSASNIKIKVSGASGRHAALMSSGCTAPGTSGGYVFVNDTAGATIGYGTKLTTWDGTNMVMTDAMNIVTGTGTGMKIGTATNQKLGFFNAPPVIQPTGVTAALSSRTAAGTYGATEQTMLQEAHDAVRTLLAQCVRPLGLCA